MEETDQHSKENPDKMIPCETVGGELTQIRYYECTFCKRGFSNAQALGGHMNIHRRQKSKHSLIPSNQTPQHHCQQSLDHVSLISPIEAAKSSNRVVRSSIKRPQLVVESDHTNYWEKPHDRAIQELPLFVESPSSNDQQNGSTRKGLPGLELDLELRLGTTDPQDPSAANGTKSFF